MKKLSILLIVVGSLSAQPIVVTPATGIQVIVTDLGPAAQKAAGITNCNNIIQQFSLTELNLGSAPQQLGWGKIVAALALAKSPISLYPQAEAVQILNHCASASWQSLLLTWAGRASAIAGLVGSFEGISKSWVEALVGVGAVAQPIGSAIAGTPPSAAPLLVFAQYPVTIQPESTGLYIQDYAYGPVPPVPPGGAKGKKRVPIAPVMVAIP